MCRLYLLTLILQRKVEKIVSNPDPRGFRRLLYTLAAMLLTILIIEQSLETPGVSDFAHEYSVVFGKSHEIEIKLKPKTAQAVRLILPA